MVRQRRSTPKQGGRISVILPAGGRGNRFGNSRPKQFIPLEGRSLILHSLEIFLHLPDIDEIIIPCHADHLKTLKRLLPPTLSPLIRVIPGGASRQESVERAIPHCSPGCAQILIHDAARPLVTSDLVSRIITALGGAVAAIPVISPRDTLVRAGKNGDIVSGILNRGTLRAVQTPQGFHREVLARAHRLARDSGETFTDDGSLVHRFFPGKVVMVKGEADNIKITTPRDLKQAGMILQERGKISI